MKNIQVCAITMVYNESFNLPIWLGHYSRQVGENNCFVVDNGSTDGSTDEIGRASRIYMPRSKFFDYIRVDMISKLVSCMLTSYDAVIYTDCDEMLVADPEKYRNLVDYCGQMTSLCATAIGMNVYQNIEREQALTDHDPILRQRSFVQFVSPMCKSLIVKEAARWGAGFHECSLPPNFDGLGLFHLRWVDVSECLRRLAITNKVQFAHAANHHHQSPSQFIQYFQDFARRKIQPEFEMGNYIARLSSGCRKNDDGLYAFQNEVRSVEAFQIPERYRDIF